MAEKDRTTISLDADLLRDAKSRDELNLSGVINDFLRGYLAHGDATSATLEARLEHLQEQRERLLEEVEEIEQEIARVEQTLEAQRDRAEEAEEQVAELAEVLPPELDQHNPAIQNWARKLDRRPAELVETVREYRQNGHGLA